MEQSETVIDVESISVTENEENEVVDLTKENSTAIVDLTNEDSPQIRYQRGKGRPRRTRRTGHPYRNRNQLLPDDPVEVVSQSSSTAIPAEGSLSPSKADSPTKTPGKKVICPICMDDVDRINRGTRHVVSTICGHIFCNTCMSEALGMQGKCPTCRKKLNKKQFHQIFI